MLEQAIKKLETEIEQNNNNSYIRVVGDYLLQHLIANPNSAEKIMAEGKTVAKSLDEMRKAAEKKKVGNCAVLTDQEGFAVVLKYYGIEAASTMATAPAPAAKKAPAAGFNVNLDDLLK